MTVTSAVMPWSPAAEATSAEHLVDEVVVVDAGDRADVDPHRTRWPASRSSGAALAGGQHGRRDPHLPEVRVRRRGAPAARARGRPARRSPRATPRFGLRPSNGIAPWAILPCRSRRRRSAPLATWQISPPSGSQQIDAVDAVGAATGDEVLGAEHHALLVDEGGQHDTTWERPARGQGVRGEEHRRQTALHVGGAPSPQAAVAHLAAEGVDGPAVTLGDDVRVALEHQRRTGTSAALDDGDDVGATRAPRRRSPAPSRTPASASARARRPAARPGPAPGRGRWGCARAPGRTRPTPVLVQVVIAVDPLAPIAGSLSNLRLRSETQVGGSKRPSAAVQPPSTKIVVPVT